MNAPSTLGPDELQRYARHLSLPEIGPGGQARLRAASVLCVGAGGLGSPVALYLAAAGIGRLGLIDFDRVDVSNLQRQVLHGTPDVGRAKADSARDRLRALNPHVDLDIRAERLSGANALELFRPYDLVVDGTDNFPARYLVNDACVLLRKPNVYGSVHRFEGQASVFAPHLGGPCYRCLFPEPPPPGEAPNCAEAGVLGVVPGMVGMIQAAEALKLVLGEGRTLQGRLLLVDVLTQTFRELKVRRDPQCPVCGERPTITGLTDYEQTCASNMNAPSSSSSPDEISPTEAQQVLQAPNSQVRLLDVREPEEHRAARIPGATLVPLSVLAQRFAELDPQTRYLIHCKSGVRSMQALRFLRERGFKDVASVRGGILAWAAEVDPSVLNG